jgi:hypothetical protein
MTQQPLDPNDPDLNEESEYGWGLGLFPPGIADGEGQTQHQDDFGDNLLPQTDKVGDFTDNYARAVADRRTDPTDPNSNRDFESYGNPDRFGGNPPLVRGKPQPNISQRIDHDGPEPLERKW